MFGRCKHDWKVIDKIILPSKGENMKECGIMATSGYPDMYSQKLILVLSCTLCGKLNKTVKTS